MLRVLDLGRQEYVVAKPILRRIYDEHRGRCRPPPGLQKFLDGGVPYGRTMAGYRLWYVHQVQEGRLAVDEEGQRIALRVLKLVFGLERQLFMERVKRQYRERAQGAPRWLDDDRS